MTFTESAVSRALVMQTKRLPDRVVGDAHGVLEVLVTDENGKPVDFSTANAITFTMVDTETGIVKVSAAASATGNDEGQLQYQALPADVDTPGLFSCQWFVDFDGAGDEHRTRRVLQRYIRELG